MPGRLQAAVRRVNMVTGMRRASGHRVGDPRDHLTTRGATGDGLDDATIYKRVQPAVGGEVADEVARVRGGFAEQAAPTFTLGEPQSVYPVKALMHRRASSELTKFTNAYPRFGLHRLRKSMGK